MVSADSAIVILSIRSHAVPATMASSSANPGLTPEPKRVDPLAPAIAVHGAGQNQSLHLLTRDLAPQLLRQRLHEELVEAGVMLAGEGLHPSKNGARKWGPSWIGCWKTLSLARNR